VCRYEGDPICLLSNPYPPTKDLRSRERAKPSSQRTIQIGLRFFVLGQKLGSVVRLLELHVNQYFWSQKPFRQSQASFLLMRGHRSNGFQPILSLRGQLLAQLRF
jgi:hypothetical protein